MILDLFGFVDFFKIGNGNFVFSFDGEVLFLLIDKDLIRLVSLLRYWRLILLLKEGVLRSVCFRGSIFYLVMIIDVLEVIIIL